ncbi:unnamed protein product [Blepharisma stoltei]|uniref:Uncharacterized protein n=1 Tax=Blepharisma stoltei TaxID=1481888 RepID=A0AAU9IEZ9_9CILI|nr:unnamed protein product [Blepharisma stoltei]
MEFMGQTRSIAQCLYKNLTLCKGLGQKLWIFWGKCSLHMQILLFCLNFRRWIHFSTILVREIINSVNIVT